MSLQLLNDNKNIEISSNGEGERQKLQEYARCAISTKYFARNYCWILNQNSKEIEKWEPWAFQLDLLDIIEQYHHIYILKASQIGISWLICIYNDWVANFNTTSKCLFLSQGQTEAQDLLSKVSFIHEHLPDWLKYPIDNENREFLSFKGTYSQIRALSSTDKAGHGFQASVATRDEVARHEFARDNYKAVARSGAKLIELSTANKNVGADKQAAYFGEKTKEFWEASDTVKTIYPSGLELYTNPRRPRACLVFLSWKLRPVREKGMTLEEWYEKAVLSEYSAIDIEEQFPARIEDVFRESSIRAYFEESALDDMSYDICEPLKQEDIDTYNGIVRIYKPPIIGHRYIVFTDPSLGVADPFVTRVKDCLTGERVATASAIIKVDYAAQIHDHLVRVYNKAWNSFEYNGSAGGEFASFLRDLGTPNMALRRDHNGKIVEGKKGLYVTPPLKKVMMERLAFVVQKRLIINHDKEFIMQARSVTRDGALPSMSRHRSYDWVMADAGLEWVDKHIPKGVVSARTIRDL